MDINQLSEDLIKRLNRDAGRYRRGRLNDERIEETLKLLKEQDNFESLTTQGLKNIYSSINLYDDQTDDIFNPRTGLISNFIIDGKNTDEIATSLVTKVNKPILLDAINNARKIDITYKAVENKESILETLNELKDVRVDKLNKDLLTDDEKNTIDKLIQRIEKVSEDSDIETAQIPEFKSLGLLEKSLVNASVLSTESRIKYYDYWKNIEDKFVEFDTAANAVDDDVREFFRAFGQEEKIVDDPYADIKRLTTTNYLPSYIVRCSALKIKDADEDTKSLELFRDFFSMIGREIPEKYKPKLPSKKDVEDAVAATAREDFDAEGGGSSVSIDPTAADDIKAEVEEAQKKIDDTKIDKYTDPLFGLLMRDNTIKGEFDDKIINKAKEYIKSELTFAEMGQFSKDIENIVNNELEKFLDRYRKSMMVKISDNKEFNIPVLDDTLAVNFFDTLEGIFKVNYFKSGRIQEQVFRKYSDAVNFINNGTVQFFGDLGKYIELKNSTKRTPKRPTARGRGGRDSTPVQYLGGITEGLQPKTTQVNLDRMKEIENMTKLISNYYIKPLTGNMVLLEDVPRFYTSPEFKDFPKILASSNVNMARRAISAGFDPVVETDDLETFITFLNRIKYHDSLVYSEDLKNLFIDALNAYIKFFAAVDSVVEEENLQIDDIIERGKILFGASLYDVASATESKKELDEIMFEYEPLSFWNEKQNEENVTIESLINLISSEEWQTFVSTTGRKTRGFKTLSERLEKKLMESDVKLASVITTAMLDATDLIRKMNGEKIYKSKLDISDIEDIEYVTKLIKKENNIDLYGIDIHNIIKSQSSFNDIASNYGLSVDVVYKVKGLFR